MNDKLPPAAMQDDDYEAGPQVSLVEVMTWLGEGKGLLAGLTALGAGLALAFALFWPPSYTAQTTLLPPGAQQQSGSAAALATLGALGALGGGLAPKTPDELYIALLRSDTVLRSLDESFKL
jgi:tyrosine-protein kinase Etk/Wzc